MARTITIPAGSTLSGLAKQYGSSIQNLLSLNPQIKDPNKIAAGATLNVPDMAGTLPTAAESIAADPAPDTDKALPQANNQSYLSDFRKTLRLATEEAVKEARQSGVGNLPVEMSNPSKMSGSSFADVISFVNSNKTQGVQDIYSSTVDLLDKAQQAAADKLNVLISSGAIANMDDNTLSKLSSMSDYSLQDLQSLRQTAIDKDSNNFIETVNGKKILYDKQGNVLKILGNASTGSSGTSMTATERLAAEKQERIQNITKELQEHIGNDFGNGSGYVDTAVYARLMLENPDLQDYFPAEQLLNPNDDTAKRFFPESSTSRSKG